MKVVIVDDADMVRNMIKSLLAELPDVQIVGEAGHVHGAIEMVRTIQPDVVILDIKLPDGSGLDVLHELKQKRPVPLVIMMTSFPSLELRTVCLKAGAGLFLDKSTELYELPEMLRTLMP